METTQETHTTKTITRLKPLLFKYAGLPSNWTLNPQKELNTGVSMKLYTAVQKINDSDRGGVALLTGNPAYIFKVFEESGIELSSIKGLDFAKYFLAKFNKEIVYDDWDAKKFTFIYNVGVEEALNKDYPSQILKGLIKKVIDASGWVFVVTDLSKTEFERNYKIKLKNTLVLPAEEAEEIF